MFKWLFTSIICILSTSVFSGDITGTGNYHGQINGVAIGFYNNVGVGLPQGETCHGKDTIVLLTTHPQYDEMLSTLLAAQASQSNVRIYQLGANTSTFGANYCVINYLSLGEFPLW